jgi:hypothetical protein
VERRLRAMPTSLEIRPFVHVAWGLQHHDP